MTDRTNRLALAAAEALHALAEALTDWAEDGLPDQAAANEERQREEIDPLHDAVPYPIPSVRDGWYQIDCPWCDWHTAGSEPVCEDAWYTHKAEKCYVEKPEHNADPEPLTANEEREREMEVAWQFRDWETVERLQNEADIKAEREDHR